VLDKYGLMRRAGRPQASQGVPSTDTKPTLR
jgi:hypothetical protein